MGFLLPSLLLAPWCCRQGRQPSHLSALQPFVCKSPNSALPAQAGTASAYMPLVFMRDRRLFDRFYTFEGAAERDFAAWRDALLWFLKVNAAAEAFSAAAPLP